MTAPLDLDAMAARAQAWRAEIVPPLAADAYRPALASVVTRQRSEIDTLRTDLELKSETAGYWESGCRQTQAQLAEARALLAELLDETGLKESYTARDGTLHPGATQTVKDVWRFLWGEGKAE